MAHHTPRRFTCPQTVTDPSNNQTRCRLITLHKANVLTTTPRRLPCLSLVLERAFSIVLATYCLRCYVEGAIYYVKIVSRLNNLVLAVKDSNKNPAALLEMQKNKTEDDSQLWLLNYFGQIKSKLNFFCVTFQGNSYMVFR